MNLLWIVPKWPFPVADGARVATTQLLKNLTALGMNVHLCALVPDGEVIDPDDAKRELGIQEVTLVRRDQPSRLSQLFYFFRRPWFPITLSQYGNEKIANRVSTIVEKSPFDLMVYDGLHASAWKHFLSTHPIRKIKEAYRAHNVESEIWFRAALDAQNILMRVLLKMQGWLVRKVEKKLASDCHYLFPVSRADERKFLSGSLIRTIHTVPIGISVPQSDALPKASNPAPARKILFIGKLDWAPNRHGLEWVLAEVWPKVVAQTKDLSLVIVGSGESKWLDKYLALPGIRFEGRVESVTPYYEDCIATLVPIFYGSGTRVKAIEASLHGRVCISTELGVEGVGLVPGESYIRVEKAEEWIHALVNLNSEDALRAGKIALNHARHEFDPRLIAERLVEKISEKR